MKFQPFMQECYAGGIQYKAKLIRNEQLIRDRNKVAAEAIKKYYAGMKDLDLSVLNFACECSDLQCDVHVPLAIEAYEKIHKQKDHFALAKGHESPLVEKIVAAEKAFEIVKKPVQSQ